MMTFKIMATIKARVVFVRTIKFHSCIQRERRLSCGGERTGSRPIGFVCEALRPGVIWFDSKGKSLIYVLLNYNCKCPA